MTRRSPSPWRRVAGPFALAAAVGLGAAVAPGAGESSGELPVAQPISRYQKIIDDSPFRKPTEAAPVATPPPKQPSFAEDLFVGGVMTLGGKNVVQLVQRSDSQRFSIATGEDNPQGLTLVNVQYSDVYMQTRVTVKKGNEFGVLMFDQNAVATRPVAPVRVPPNPGIPGAPPPVSNFTPPGGRPNNGFTPPAGARTSPPTPPPVAIPQPGGGISQPLPVPGGNAVPGDPGGARQRPRPLIKAEPNAQPTPPPAQRVLPGRAEVTD